MPTATDGLLPPHLHAASSCSTSIATDNSGFCGNVPPPLGGNPLRMDGFSRLSITPRTATSGRCVYSDGRLEDRRIQKPFLSLDSHFSAIFPQVSVRRNKGCEKLAQRRRSSGELTGRRFLSGSPRVNPPCL